MNEQNDDAVDLIARRILQAVQEPADRDQSFVVDAEASLHALAKVASIVLGAADLRDSEVDFLSVRFRMTFDNHMDQVRSMKAPSQEGMRCPNRTVVSLSEWVKER